MCISLYNFVLCNLAVYFILLLKKINLNWQVVEVRIESVEHRHDDVTGSHDNDDAEDAGEDMDIATRPHEDSQPLLVVFSNDRHHRRFDSRELNELIEREMELYKTGDLPAAAVAAAGLPDYSDDDYVDYDSADYDDDDDDDETERVMSRVERDTAAVSDAVRPSRRRAIVSSSFRTRRAKSRRRTRRNICRRRPMYVNFQDIHWDGWIIEPKGYQVRNTHKVWRRLQFPACDKKK